MMMRRTLVVGACCPWTFYDLDFPTAPALFAHLGLADSAFNAKPALTVWDQAFARPHNP